MSDRQSDLEEVTAHMNESWLDDESVPASWLNLADDDPGQTDEPAPSPAASQTSLPAADQTSSADPELPAEPPWWLTDEFCGTPEEEHAAWLAGLPADIRADYLAGPYTGAGEAIAPGFTHHDDGGPSGAGFAAGGALDQMPPGPWLAEALAEATDPDYRELTNSEQIGVLCGWQRQAAWAQAGLAAAAMSVARRRDVQATQIRNPHLSEHVPDELAAALALTPLSAGRLLTVAAGLDRLPEVAAALAAGQVDWPKACIYIDELSVLGGDLARDVATKLLAAGRLTTSQLRTRLRRAVLAADPAAADRRQKEGRKDTRVETGAEPSGNSSLAGRELRPADAIAADAQLTADAAWLRDNGAAGTLAELRSAAFIARLSGRDLATLVPAPDTAAASPPDSPASPPATPASPPASPAGSVHLIMPWSAWLGSGGPGEVASYGPVDAATSRELARLLARDPATRWCLTLTGPDGQAVAHACARRGPAAGEPAITWAAGLREQLLMLESGTCRHARQAAGYVPPPRLRHLVMVRQRRCAFPSCRWPARRCDLDHTVPFDNGGFTCECNLAPLCRRHHRAKVVPGWELTQDQPGHMTWRLPGGRTYQTTGEPYPV